MTRVHALVDMKVTLGKAGHPLRPAPMFAYWRSDAQSAVRGGKYSFFYLLLEMPPAADGVGVGDALPKRDVIDIHSGWSRV
ncbi:golgin subfamily B member 1 X5 [Biomphalaria glabrata]|nr:golgin subfamily B member 1 X5 [Biomphalaria glabrata]